jgi:hypothetical protein
MFHKSLSIVFKIAIISNLVSLMAVLFKYLVFPAKLKKRLEKALGKGNILPKQPIWDISFHLPSSIAITSSPSSVSLFSFD